MLFAYAWKGFWRRGTKTMLAVAGVALAVGLFVGVVAITQSIHRALVASLEASGADVVVSTVVKPCGYAPVKLRQGVKALPQDLVTQLGQADGVEDISGVLELWAFPPPPNGDHPVMVAGVDPDKTTLGPSKIHTREGSKKDEKNKSKCCSMKLGRYLVANDDYHVVLSETYFKEKGLQLGQKIFLGPNRRFEIVGVVDLSGEARIAGAEAFIPLKTAQALLDQFQKQEGPVVTTIFVAVKEGASTRPVEDLARKLVGSEVSFTTAANVDQGTAVLASTTRRALVAISLLVLAFTVALLVRSGIESVMERITEVGLMKALGWRNGDVGRLFLVEAVYTGLAGGVLGCLIGWALALAYGTSAHLRLPDQLAGFAGCSSTAPPLNLSMVSTSPHPALFIGGMVAALVIGAFAGTVAAYRAAKLDPVVALRRV